MPIKVQVTGPLFSPGLADKTTREELKQGIDGTAETLRSAIEAKAPRATGQLKSGIRIANRKSGAAVTSSKRYGIPVDQGNKPGYMSKKGVQKAALWAQAALGLDPKQALRAAHAISRDHSKHGTPKREFFYKTFDRLQSQLMHQMDPIASRIAQKLNG